MLCLDIDGTLLNSQHKITEKTGQAITKIKDKVKIILVSARPPTGIYPLQQQLSLKESIISYSGALIFDKDQNELLNKSIAVQDLEYIYSNYREKVHISLYSGNNWFVEKEDKWARQEAKITGLTPEEVYFPHLFEKWNTKGVEAANKILLMGDSKDIAKIEKSLKEKELGVIAYRSKPEYLEIMNKNVSKKDAIKVLASRYGIKHTEIMAIGDNYNDLDMLEFAGLGVAMGNAPYEVKKVADEVTLSNNEDGVAKILNKYY